VREADVGGIQIRDQPYGACGSLSTSLGGDSRTVSSVLRLLARLPGWRCVAMIGIYGGRAHRARVACREMGSHGAR